MDSSEEFLKIDNVGSNLTKCYQMQVDENDIAHPVYIGSYEEIPLQTHATILYDQSKDIFIHDDTNHKNNKNNKDDKNVYRVHVVTYIVPEDVMNTPENKYQIVGMIIQKNDEEKSLSSFDLMYNTKTKKYEYIYCDHDNDTQEVIEILDKFPGKEHVLEELLERLFNDRFKSILLS